MGPDFAQARPDRQGQNPLGQAQLGRFSLSACTWEGRIKGFMDNPEVIIGLLIGAALGGVIGWLLGSRKGARAEAEREAAERRIEEHQKTSEAQLAALRLANDEAVAQLKESFKALSADALKQAQPELVRLANETLGKFHATAKGAVSYTHLTLPTKA